ncbi:MAG: TIGR01212 family radical SAM protein, partial [Candidatus Auribacterota bacterium]|nr:TIGR01212 family radical SAM protein [Candidatus Auribacterota bacterium]
MQTKRYYALNMYFKSICPQRVGKICVDAGFTCPNRDGTISDRGCLFCDDKGSAADYIKRNLPVREQVKAYLKEKSRGDKRYIVYFQPFTNTYEKASVLKDLYEAVFVNDRIIGISIGTRPDCIDPEKISIIRDIAENNEVWLEMGLQTSNDKTLGTINRGHTAEDFKNAVDLTKGTRIKVCALVIFRALSRQPDYYMRTNLYPGSFCKVHRVFEVFCGMAPVNRS